MVNVILRQPGPKHLSGSEYLLLGVKNKAWFLIQDDRLELKWMERSLFEDIDDSVFSDWHSETYKGYIPTWLPSFLAKRNRLVFGNHYWGLEDEAFYDSAFMALALQSNGIALSENFLAFTKNERVRYGIVNESVRSYYKLSHLLSDRFNIPLIRMEKMSYAMRNEEVMEYLIKEYDWHTTIEHKAITNLKGAFELAGAIFQSSFSHLGSFNKSPQLFQDQNLMLLTQIQNETLLNFCAYIALNTFQIFHYEIPKEEKVSIIGLLGMEHTTLLAVENVIH